MFKDVVIFSFSEPGALGDGGYIDCITDRGEDFSICYLSEETPWNEVKNCFPVLKECCFNGSPPLESRRNEPKEIVIYLDESDIHKPTRVARGWSHIYMGFGNHLVIRDDHYLRFQKCISDLVHEVDIYVKWHERALQYIQSGGTIIYE